MPLRTFDPVVVARATDQVKDDLKGLPPLVWLGDNSNVALTNEHGDVALFEPRGNGIYCGHYFFISRGKKAATVAKIFLTEFFTSYGIIVIGFTPHDKHGAMGLTKHLGFSFVSDEDIDGRPHRVSVMTKKDWFE